MKAWGIGVIAYAGMLVLVTGCASQTVTMVGEEKPLPGKTLKTERVEDPLARLPIAPPASEQPTVLSQADIPAPPAGPPAQPPGSGVSPAEAAAQVIPGTQSIGEAAAAEASGATPFLLDIPFLFDRFSLRSDARNMVEVNAMRLKEQPGWSVLLEGRGDEVGTTEYNLVLGERRARTVRQYLENLGLPSPSMGITSYGKESPLCLEHSVECWAQNRSVHFLLR